MMRPMKLAGSELMFGAGCLAYLKTIKATRATIVIGGSSMERSGMLSKVQGYLAEGGAQTEVFEGVEPDPHFSTVLRGAKAMQRFQPDLIVALGGGSVMDAAKTMWIFYEHEELTRLADILPPNSFPKLHKKARFCCIPSTSGTASEVSRSVVITDDETGMKIGIGNMEMMPDIAVCDPEVTLSMPAHITAETGMDALTHALEALVSNRANYVSDILATKAAQDIIATLPVAYRSGDDLAARETLQNASMVAGMAFTNVSLGIVHSMAHTLGSYFHLAHGLADAVLLPYIVRFNSGEAYAKAAYDKFAQSIGSDDLVATIQELNRQVHIASAFRELVPDREKYFSLLTDMAKTALADGCTKTNPIIPKVEQMKNLFAEVYGNE